eukprot:7958738-Pyramimonas_sp.AAC.2
MRARMMARQMLRLRAVVTCLPMASRRSRPSARATARIGARCQSWMSYWWSISTGCTSWARIAAWDRSSWRPSAT